MINKYKDIRVVVLVTFLLTSALFYIISPKEYSYYDNRANSDIWRNIHGITLDEANEMFQNCCRTIKLPDACLVSCRYDYDAVKSRLVLFENQDRNACDVVDNIKLLAKCANGLNKQTDVRQCCLKYGAIVDEDVNQDPCAYFCHPHGKEDLTLETRHVKCAVKFRRASFCHFMHLQR